MRIGLNGVWQVSFDNSAAFSNFSVPLAYTFTGNSVFAKDFKLPDSLLKNYAFLLVAESINYTSDIRINDAFITLHSGGFSSIVTPVDENILRENNRIVIKVNNELNNKNTLPLEAQVNYQKNYGGICGDIYLIVVPKIYVFDNYITTIFDSETHLRIVNNIDINSGNLGNLNNPGSSFSVRTQVYKKSGGDEITESPSVKFELGEYQSKRLVNELAIKSPSLWSPDSPELYYLKTSVYSGDLLIDEKTIETGFCNILIGNIDLTVNNKNIVLNGINYYDNSPKFASAVEYSEIEKDLRKIKELGINCIRIPGKSANPYVINACQRIGLFLLEEIPFNEVPEELLSSKDYKEKALEYMSEIVKRDRNSPSVLMWGAGNDFDVSVNSAAEYMKSIKETVSLLDKRKVYYTSRSLNTDVCAEIADAKGINIISGDLNKISGLSSMRLKLPVFISSYGYCIDNFNRNGYGDFFSNEAQARFLTESYKIFSKQYFGSFIKSYSDFVSQSPLLFPLSPENEVNTSGIFDLKREAKYSVPFIKRLLNNQGFQKIPEGNGENGQGEKHYVYIIFGVFGIMLFVFSLGRIRYFNSNTWRSLITPSNFLYIVREQNPVSYFQNLVLSFCTSAGLAVYFSSVLYSLRQSNGFDMILSKIFSSDFLKSAAGDFINNPFLSILLFFVFFFLSSFVLSFLLNNLMIFSRRMSNQKATYTVFVWSFLPLVIFLLLGTVFYRISLSQPEFLKYSLLLFIVLYVFSLYKLTSGLRVVYELGVIKTYFYAILLVLIFHGSVLSYLVIFKSVNIFISLVLSYGA